MFNLRASPRNDYASDRNINKGANLMLERRVFDDFSLSHREFLGVNTVLPETFLLPATILRLLRDARKHTRYASSIKRRAYSREDR